MVHKNKGYQKDDRESLKDLRKHKETSKVFIDHNEYNNIQNAIEELGKLRGFPVSFKELSKKLGVSENSLQRKLKIHGIHIEDGGVY